MNGIKRMKKARAEFRSGKISWYHRFENICIPESISFMPTLYKTRYENNLTTFNDEVYQTFLYYVSNLTIANVARELNIPVFLDNACTFSIMPKHYHNNHVILNTCQKMPAGNMIILTGNNNIEVHFWALLPQFVLIGCNIVTALSL